jgi:hypothetical protein
MSRSIACTLEGESSRALRAPEAKVENFIMPISR